MNNYICDNYVIARMQRKRETSSGLGLEGTMGFEDKGCFDCDGLPPCDSHSNELKIEITDNPNCLVYRGRK